MGFSVKQGGRKAKICEIWKRRSEKQQTLHFHFLFLANPTFSESRDSLYNISLKSSKNPNQTWKILFYLLN